MDHAEAEAVEHERGERRAHARLLRVVLHGLGDRRVRVLRRRPEQGEHVRVAGVAVQVLHVLDHELGGDLAGCVAAHAVGKHEQLRARVCRILVVAPDQAAVGRGDVV